MVMMKQPAAMPPQGGPQQKPGLVGGSIAVPPPQPRPPTTTGTQMQQDQYGNYTNMPPPPQRPTPFGGPNATNGRGRWVDGKPQRRPAPQIDQRALAPKTLNGIPQQPGWTSGGQQGGLQQITDPQRLAEINAQQQRAQPRGGPPSQQEFDAMMENARAQGAPQSFFDQAQAQYQRDKQMYAQEPWVQDMQYQQAEQARIRSRQGY